MSQHVCKVHWERQGPDFLRGQYSREHVWSFDGGIEIPASPSPHVVPSPWSNSAFVDPEEAFVAAVSSCHMLTFLWLASKAGWVADEYVDHAIGEMTRNDRGVLWVSTISLRPQIIWSGERIPSPSEVEELHHQAHDQCFIAQSIQTQVVVLQPE